MSIIKKILGGAALFTIGIATGIYTVSNYDNIRRYLPIKHQEEQMATIQEYAPDKYEAASNKIEKIDLDELIKREPETGLERFRQMEGINSIYYGDINNNGRNDLVLNTVNGSPSDGEDNPSDIKIYEKVKEAYIMKFARSQNRGTNLYIRDVRDLNNDGLYEILVNDLSCGASRCYGDTEIIWYNNGQYGVSDKINNNLIGKIEDIDGDSIYELLADDIAPGQWETRGMSEMQNWYIVYKWDGSRYKDVPDLRILDDGSTTTASNPNPYNVLQPKPRIATHQPTQSHQEGLEERIGNYPQQPYQDQYYNDLTEKHIRLNLVLENEFKTSQYSGDDRIRNARVHYTIAPGSKQDILLRDNPASNRGNGIYSINEDIQLSSNDYAYLCLILESQNRLPINKCFDSDSLERTQIGDQFQDESSRATFTTVKPKGQSVIGYTEFQGKLEDVTIRIDWPKIEDLPRGTFP